MSLEGMDIRVSALSDIGKLRKVNQDDFYVDEIEPALEATHGRLFILADGMGGHAAGEVASKMATNIVSEEYYRTPVAEVADPCPALKRAFRAANEAIQVNGSKNLENYGMGTTCSAVLLRDQMFWICHVGDSRVYRYRAGQMATLTRDHTLLNQMLDKGDISPKEAARLSIRHILVRAMGIGTEVKVDQSETPYPIIPGDKLMLCSDGLYSVIRDEDLATILSVRSGEEAVKLLVDEANKEGGPDNITVILVEYGVEG